MIKKNVFDEIKRKYGCLSSWAIWAQPTTTIKSNTGDLDIFNMPDLLNILHSKYVFVGLNISKELEVQEKSIEYWKNFHLFRGAVMQTEPDAV